MAIRVLSSNHIVEGRRTFVDAGRSARGHGPAGGETLNEKARQILQLEKENPDRKLTVVLPELVVRHWWDNLLHNQRVQLLKLLLLLRGNQRIVVVNIPWYL